MVQNPWQLAGYAVSISVGQRMLTSIYPYTALEIYHKVYAVFNYLNRKKGPLKREDFFANNLRTLQMAW